MAKVFHALDRNESEPSGEIFDVLTGVGVLTEGRSSKIYQRDWEDFWRSWESGEPAWFGGRKVENLVFPSEDFDGPGWSEVGDVSDVDNNDGSFTLTFSTTGQANRHQLPQTADLTTGDTATFSIELKAGTLSSITLQLQDNLTPFTFTTAVHSLTDEFVRYFVTRTATVADIATILASLYSNSGTGTILARRAQIEQVNGQADQTPSEYIPTTTAAAHKIFGTDRSGVPFASLPWLYGGPAGTNEITFSRDLTNAEWEKIGTPTPALDEIGLEGVANTASTLTDNDVAVFERVTETITIIDDSNTHVVRAWIKKDSDETRFPEIQLQLLGGTVQELGLDVNTKTGASATRISTGTTNGEVNDNGLWWEVLVEVTNNGTGNVNATILVYPAASVVIGTSSVTAVGSCIIGNIELHLNKTIAQVRGTTPIFTSGSTVTVDATDLSFDDANHDDLEGAYFCEFKNVGMATGSVGGLVGMGANGRIFHATVVTSMRAFDGTTLAVSPAITLAADDTEYKLGLAYGSSLQRVNIDDSFGAEVAYDGSYNNTESKLNVLHNNSLVTDPPAVMLLRNLRRYDVTYAQALIDIPNMMNGIFPEIKLPRLLTVMDTFQYKPLR